MAQLIDVHGKGELVFALCGSELQAYRVDPTGLVRVSTHPALEAAGADDDYRPALITQLIPLKSQE